MPVGLFDTEYGPLLPCRITE